jgi:hypothetical protein
MSILDGHGFWHCVRGRSEVEVGLEVGAGAFVGDDNASSLTFWVLRALPPDPRHPANADVSKAIVTTNTIALFAFKTNPASSIEKNNNKRGGKNFLSVEAEEPKSCFRSYLYRFVVDSVSLVPHDLCPASK